MRYARSGFLFLALLLVQGCAETAEPDKALKIGPGTTRAEVEELLGESVQVKETSDGLIYTYSYTVEDNLYGSGFTRCAKSKPRRSFPNTVQQFPSLGPCIAVVAPKKIRAVAYHVRTA